MVCLSVLLAGSQEEEEKEVNPFIEQVFKYCLRVLYTYTHSTYIYIHIHMHPSFPASLQNMNIFLYFLGEQNTFNKHEADLQIDRTNYLCIECFLQFLFFVVAFFPMLETACVNLEKITAAIWTNASSPLHGNFPVTRGSGSVFWRNAVLC